MIVFKDRRGKAPGYRVFTPLDTERQVFIQIECLDSEFLSFVCAFAEGSENSGCGGDRCRNFGGCFYAGIRH